MDREKVIKELGDSLKNQHCGFVDGVGDVYAVSDETIKNILALLKEQEAIEPIVHPETKYHYEIKECGACGTLLTRGARFCSKCGRQVKRDV